jgi:hypothetical protein
MKQACCLKKKKIEQTYSKKSLGRNHKVTSVTGPATKAQSRDLATQPKLIYSSRVSR